MQQQKSNANLKIKDKFRHVVSMLMKKDNENDEYAQVSLKKGIKRFSDDAINSMMAEYAQIDDKNVFDLLMASKLSQSDKRKALRMIALILKKRSGKIKGRAVADGSRQRVYTNKDEVTSPTIHLESLILSMVIDGHERRDVSTCDVAGAFLIPGIDNFKIIKLDGDMVDIMCDANNRYKKYVTYECGKNFYI